jgi:hypothetical protein
VGLAIALLTGAPAAARGGSPTLTLDPDIGPAGATFEANGSGFGDACGARIVWDAPLDGQVLATVPVNSAGSFTTEVVVPSEADTGDHEVFALALLVDANGRCARVPPDVPLASAFFDVTAPPPAPVADLELSNSTAKPGEVVFLDAGGSSGDLVLIAFDLDGNGSYESKCGEGGAGVVSGKQGTKTVGVQVTSTDGQKASAQVNLTIAGSPAQPPPKPGGGTYAPFKAGTISGACAESSAEALIKAYQCPTTVKVGVAEATIPYDLPGEPCFERKNPGAKLAFFRAESSEVLLNGLRMKTLKSQSRLAILEQLKRVEINGPVGKDDTTFKVSKPGYSSAIGSSIFHPSWDVSKAGKVGTVPIAKPLGLFGTFLGLPYSSKSTDLRLTAGGGARFNLYLELPLPKILFKSLASSKPLEVRTSNTDGIEVAGGYTISISDVFVGLFTLKKISVSYERQGSSNVWGGAFDLEFPSSGVAADGQVTVRDGVLESLSAAINPGPPGIGPVGCCVWIVGFDGQLTNQFINAGATFAAGPQVVGNVRAADAHGSATIYYEPFEFLLTVDDVHIVTIPVNAKGQVAVTLNSFAFTAYLDESFGPFSFAADLTANVGASNGGITWFAGGSGDGCVDVIIDACVTVKGGAGPKGVAGCGGITIIPGTWVSDPVKLYGGAVVFWPIGSGFDTFSGCGMGKIQSKVGAARLARARARARGVTGPTTSVQLPRGMASALFEIEGDGGHPEVRLRGPEGVDVSTTEAGDSTADGPGYFISKVTPEDKTYIAIGRPPKGRYRITELPGSAPVTGIGVGEGMPAKMARGRVTGTGRKRTLTYKVARIPGVKVVFVERGGPAEPDEPGESVDEVIGQTRGGKGKLRFTPAEARVRKRRVEAVVVNQGATFETELVDRFRASAFKRLPGPKVNTRRRGSRLLVRWSRVGGAIGYRVVVDLADSPTRSFERKPGARSLKLRGVSKRDRGRIEVRAISEAGYIGRPGVKRIRR